MADVTLAELHGRVWLVGGEQYIDDLLANTLPPEISIELVPCEHKSDVNALWLQLCGPQDSLGDPWVIHPGIVARIRRSAASHSVFFAEWSAALDKDARTVIASVAAFALENDATGIDLVEVLDPAGPKSIADLSRLRAQLVEEALVAAGVPETLIGRASQAPGDGAGMAQESQRIDLLVKLANTATP